LDAFGRPGRHKHTHPDHSIEMEILAARKITDGCRAKEEVRPEAECFKGGDLPFHLSRETANS